MLALVFSQRFILVKNNHSLFSLQNVQNILEIFYQQFKRIGALEWGSSLQG